MEKILVTGANGKLGRETIEFLLKKVPAKSIVGLVKSMDNTEDLVAKGIELREGDYFNYDSLLRAFVGIDRVLLISAVAFTDRVGQHINVIKAAKASGVKHLAYTSILRKKEPTYIMPWVTESDTVTEKYLKVSGLKYTILRNPLYLDASIISFLGKDVLSSGVRVPAGNGKTPAVVLRDLAEANALVLTEPGHENKEYNLTSKEAFSFADIARTYSEVYGRPVEFQDIPAADYIKNRMAEGWPARAAEFVSQWIEGIRVGAFEDASDDLERILKRPPISLKDYLLAGLSLSACKDASKAPEQKI